MLQLKSIARPQANVCCTYDERQQTNIQTAVDSPQLSVEIQQQQ